MMEYVPWSESQSPQNVERPKNESLDQIMNIDHYRSNMIQHTKWIKNEDCVCNKYNPGFPIFLSMLPIRTQHLYIGSCLWFPSMQPWQRRPSVTPSLANSDNSWRTSSPALIKESNTSFFAKNDRIFKLGWSIILKFQRDLLIQFLGSLLVQVTCLMVFGGCNKNGSEKTSNSGWKMLWWYDQLPTHPPGAMWLENHPGSLYQAE